MFGYGDDEAVRAGAGSSLVTRFMMCNASSGLPATPREKLMISQLIPSSPGEVTLPWVARFKFSEQDITFIIFFVHYEVHEPVSTFIFGC